jgi:OOP family OmpA-OmpF porin
MNWNWIAASVLAFASAGQALAQDSEEQQGAYIGGAIGESATQVDVYNVDESETAYKLFGGYRFNQFFAVQLDYMDLGRTDSSVGTQHLQIDTRGYAARIEGTLPLAFFELYATAGLIFSSVDGDLNGTEIFSSSDSDPVYGVGAGLEGAERLVLRLEYEIMDIDALDDADAIWFSVAWRL